MLAPGLLTHRQQTRREHGRAMLQHENGDRAMNVVRRNADDHIRRNPQDAQGKLRGGGGDVLGDEEMQVEEWKELVAEEEGDVESRISDVGNAQDALLAGSGDLDHVARFDKDRSTHEKVAAEDDAELINPLARSADDDRDSRE
jgi:hypothetical protein